MSIKNTREDYRKLLLTISPNTKEKANSCGKFWWNLKGKRVESCGDLTLHDFSMHCKTLYELSLLKR